MKEQGSQQVDGGGGWGGGGTSPTSTSLDTDDPHAKIHIIIINTTNRHALLKSIQTDPT